MSMLENLKKTESEHGLGGDYYKVQTGNNLVRVLSEGVYRESEFKDPKTGQVKTTKKFVMFIIDRKDGKVKPYFAPYAAYKQIAGLEEDPFFAFAGMPMPYDINIKTTDAGTINAEYNVQASPNKTPLSPEELAELKEKGSILDYVARLDKTENKGANGQAAIPQQHVNAALDAAREEMAEGVNF